MLVVGIKSKDDLARFITQEPLVDTKPSLAGISTIQKVTALYFGVGLCNGAPVLSTGLPVDVLNMLLISEQIDTPKHILIADTHATTNGFDAQSVDRLAHQYQEKLRRAVENMRFVDWQIMRASEIDQTQAYVALLSVVDPSHDYTRRELADMLWFHRERKVNLKVGWALNGNKKSDETSFDSEFQHRFSSCPLGFVYVIPGRTFDPKRLRSAPYFCMNPNERILLEADENVARKIALAQEHFGENATRPYENFLNQIVRLYDKTVEQTERGPLSDRLQQVIDRCTK